MQSDANIGARIGGNIVVESFARLLKKNGFVVALYDWQNNKIIFHDKDGKIVFDLDEVAEEARRQFAELATSPRKK